MVPQKSSLWGVPCSKSMCERGTRVTRVLPAIPGNSTLLLVLPGPGGRQQFLMVMPARYPGTRESTKEFSRRMWSQGYPLESQVQFKGNIAQYKVLGTFAFDNLLGPHRKSVSPRRSRVATNVQASSGIQLPDRSSKDDCGCRPHQLDGQRRRWEAIENPKKVVPFRNRGRGRAEHDYDNSESRCLRALCVDWDETVKRTRNEAPLERTIPAEILRLKVAEVEKLCANDTWQERRLIITANALLMTRLDSDVISDQIPLHEIIRVRKKGGKKEEDENEKGGVKKGDSSFDIRKLQFPAPGAVNRRPSDQEDTTRVKSANDYH
eukprot:12596-Rhodomonas_salina.1